MATVDQLKMTGTVKKIATDEHLKMAAVVKKVHADLRSKLKSGRDFHEVWTEHLAQDSILKEYSASMKELATQHWSKLESEDETTSRIVWVHQKVCQYYFSDGRRNQLKKDGRRLKRYDQLISQDSAETINIDISRLQENLRIIEETEESRNPSMDLVRLKLLDVGSCYNPFSKYSEFDVTALDIAPAQNDVFKCDFLGLKVEQTYLESEGEIKSLTSSSFDAVIFCLLLEYLPTRHTRYECCLKALQLLRNNGILVIITPDSCHETRNSRLIKGWKEALHQIGFQKVFYEKKKHFHGLVFRKLDDLQKKLANLERTNFFSEEELVSKFSIPQDFSNSPEEEEDAEILDASENPELQTDRVMEHFTELPHS